MVFRDTINALHSRCEALDQDLSTTRKELDVARRELAEAQDELHRVHADQALVSTTRELETEQEPTIEPLSARPLALITKVLDLSLVVTLVGFIAMGGISTCGFARGFERVDILSGVGICFAAAFVVSLLLQIVLVARRERA